MRFSEHEQRLMDQKSGEEQDRYMRKWRLSQPCKNKSAECRHDGGCLRCDADAGEVCRPT